MTPDLAASYARCRDLLAHHGRTYYLASRLLPKNLQPAVWALYGFARYVDDLVDVDLNRVPDASAVDAIEVALDAGIATGTSDHPVLAAAVDTVRRYDIDPAWLRDFLTSMRMDLIPREYRTWDDLSAYTWGSASVIGLQMARVIGVSGDPATAHDSAAALGEAFQITNFCRDYDEDLARGRVYLPTDLFASAGVEPGSRERAAVAQVIRRASDHARQLYDNAEPGITLLDPSGQPCIRAAFTLYKGILDEIAAADYDVIGVRHRVGRARRVVVAAPLLARSVAIRLRPQARPHRQH